jgi:hypothetical protein
VLSKIALDVRSAPGTRLLIPSFSSHLCKKEAKEKQKLTEHTRNITSGEGQD